MSKNYTLERFTPKNPTCGKSIISLNFNGQQLTGSGSKNNIIYSAVSGRPNSGKFDYSQERQKIQDQGPIPEGNYWIQPFELQENAWYRLRNPQRAWGDFWITIHPYPNTMTHGRGGFFIHGGATAGSAGCIDLTTNMNDFIQQIKTELGKNTNCHIPLVVKYLR
jgi:Protein of unknown function (DUF2778)